MYLQTNGTWLVSLQDTKCSRRYSRLLLQFALYYMEEIIEDCILCRGISYPMENTTQLGAKRNVTGVDSA